MRKTPLLAAGALALASLTVVGVTTQTAHAAPADYVYALSGSNLLTFDVSTPGTVTTKTITGVNVSETLVGIDVRPQNGQLYALGVNATANTATLYAISAQTGVAGTVGAAGSVAFTTDGVTQVDLPDPAVVGYGVDINPAADRVRVVAGALNFRVNPNTGAGVDGDNTGLTSGNVSGINPDGAVNGGATTLDGTAYTNNVPNTTVTTLYTLDAATNGLYRQSSANTGTAVGVATVTVGGSTLDFTGVTGFDIPSGVNAASSNAAVAAGSAYAALTVGGVARLYTINLVSGAATVLGTIGTGSTAIQGLAMQRDVDEGYPVVGLNAGGSVLVRFSTAIPGTTTTQSVNLAALAPGETRLAAISWRPLTGQLIGLGINHTNDNGTLYLVDPQTGAVSSIGATGSVAWVESDGTTPFDLPNPAVRPYAMDVNPMVDRVRITAGADLNARVNPSTGASVDGNAGVTGTNPDGATGRALSAVAYTNAYGGAAATTVYALSAIPDEVLTLNPPNAGILTNPLPVTLGGQPIDLAALAGMDIPEDVPGTAYAVLEVGSQPGLFTIDLATGAATNLGNFGGALRSIAVGQAGANRPVPPVVTPPTTTPPTTPPTTTPPPSVTPATLTKVGKAAQKKKSIDTGQSLACPTAFATATCTTTIKVTASYKVKGKKKPKTVVVAKATVSTAKGSATRLRVTLSKAGVKLLKQRKALAATVAITAPTGAAAAARTTTVTVKLSRKKV